jgi:hypothetical protein
MPCCHILRSASLVLAAAGLVATGMFIARPAAGQPGDHAKPPAAAAPAKPQGAGPDFVSALKSTPGCLGVESALTLSGKRAVFAWFKDKASLFTWYDSDAHKKMMHALGDEDDFRKPLASVPDDAGPIMVIASYTPSDKPAPEGAPFSFSQISVELYQPLPGGIELNGRFSPAAVPVKEMVRYSQPAPGQPKGK